MPIRPGTLFLCLLGPLLGASGCLLERTGTTVDDAGEGIDAGAGTDAGGARDAFVPVPDGCVPGALPELCNGVDDDCDPSTRDGADEAWFAMPCDGPAPGMCLDGVDECIGGERTCLDSGRSGEELCDGADNDCDASTPDGADEPTLGDACDGTDDDLCTDGTITCAGGDLGCDDASNDHVETCNGEDDDCDGDTDEGVLNACGACGPPPSEVVCNGADENCDGEIDEGSGVCPESCTQANFGGHSYLFCDDDGTGARMTWAVARAHCEMLGYELAQIDSDAENEFVRSTAATVDGNHEWWLGLTDAAVEGDWRWQPSGAAPGYDNWTSGSIPSTDASKNCAFLKSDAVGDWDHAGCGAAYRFVCEAE